MASLRAMLAAQAKESSAGVLHQKELKEKEDRIQELEKRIAEIEKELLIAKQMVEKLEYELRKQAEESAKDKEQLQQLRARRRQSQPDQSPMGSKQRKSSMSYEAPESPISKRKSLAAGSSNVAVPEGIPEDYVSPEALAQHRAKVATLEEELENERKLRRDADGEIIKLRAAINGVNLNDDEVKALLSPRSPSVSVQSSFSENDFGRKR